MLLAELAKLSEGCYRAGGSVAREREGFSPHCDLEGRVNKPAVFITISSNLDLIGRIFHRFILSGRHHTQSPEQIKILL